jgi:hypothetical protein
MNTQNDVKVKIEVTNMFGENDIDIKTIYVVDQIPISSRRTGFPNFRDLKGRRHYTGLSEGIVNEIYSEEENSMNRTASSMSTSGNTRLSSKEFEGIQSRNQSLPSFTKTSNKNLLKNKIMKRMNKGKKI